MTTPISPIVRRAIESFAAKMRVSARAAADNSYGFQFSRSGTLSILQSEDDGRIIVGLARAPNCLDASTQMHLLSLAGFDARSCATVHAGIALDGTCVLALAFEETQIDEQSLDEALFRLRELQSSIASLSQTHNRKTETLT